MKLLIAEKYPGRRGIAKEGMALLSVPFFPIKYLRQVQWPLKSASDWLMNRGAS